jgi:hypothetical protein
MSYSVDLGTQMHKYGRIRLPLPVSRRIARGSSRCDALPSRLSMAWIFVLLTPHGTVLIDTLDTLRYLCT